MAAMRAFSTASKRVSALPEYRVAITGASGMLGQALAEALSVPSLSNRHNPVIQSMVRHKPTRKQDIEFLPKDKFVDLEKLNGVNAVVNLAGEGMGLRLSERSKHNIVQSRLESTELLAKAVLALDEKPEVVISASGIGYYGRQTGDTLMTEDSPFSENDGFLADLAQVWEEAIAPVAQAGVRVVNARIGVVVDPAGGALQRMLPAFKFGLGGVLGSGDQYLSWISKKDLVDAMLFTLHKKSLSGPVNYTSPNPVTNREMTKTLGKVLRRPTLLTTPEAAVRALFGELADETVLASQRVMPKKLQDAGFKFSHPTFEEAMRHVL